jgi:hypothetical protein
MQTAGKLGLEAAFDVLLLGAGCAIAYVSWGYGFGSLARPGPGLYPFFIGVLIALFAAFALIAHLRSPRTYAPLDKRQTRTLLLMSLTFCLWILVMPILGYVVMTALATYAFCKTMRLEGWVKPLALSAGTALFIYLLFDKWLYIDLPRGIFGT